MFWEGSLFPSKTRINKERGSFFVPFLFLTKKSSRVATYNFAIEVVLLDHDCVDGLGIAEGEETEATRATSGAVTHHGAFLDFAELREVVAKRFCIDEQPARLEPGLYSG